MPVAREGDDTARGELREALHALHGKAGRPSSRTLATKIGNVSHSYVNQVLKGAKVPSWPVLAKLVSALNGNEQLFRELWIAAKDAGSSSDGLQTPSFPRGDVSVFVSYARVDNEATYGRLVRFVQDVGKMYKSATGLDVELFVDADSIAAGENWRDRIRLGLSSTSVLLAFVTPAYLRSENCRAELTEFMAFLRTNSTTRLVIPLIYVARDRIDRTSAGDRLWNDLEEIQSIDVSPLRTQEIGSAVWISTVESVADRIDDILTTLVVEGRTGSLLLAAEPSLDAEQGEGFLETSARIEEQMPSVLTKLTRLGTLLNELAAIADESTPGLAAADTFARKLTATKRAATKFEPIAEEMDVLTSDIRSGIEDWQVLIDAVFRSILTAESPDPARLRFIDSVAEMCTSALSGLHSINYFAESLGPLIGLSAALDRPVRKMRAASLRLADLRALFNEWLEQATRLREMEVRGDAEPAAAG